MKHENITTEWPAGVSDGLFLDCSLCRQHTDFDYCVEDGFWLQVVPAEYRLGVVCLTCLDRLAISKGVDVSAHLLSVDFTGRGKTIRLRPEIAYHYQPPIPALQGNDIQSPGARVSLMDLFPNLNP